MTTVLITGANKGLGRETARQLSELGWTVLLGARDPEKGQQAAAEIAVDGADVRFIQIDVTSDESVAVAAQQVATDVSYLDVLINNAGITGPWVGPLETGPEHLLECYEVNVFGPVRVTRAFLPLLEAADQPRVVMVSSGLGSLTVTSDPQSLEYTINALTYPSSKSALNMVTTQYAKALPKWRINAADPGYTATDLNFNQGHKTVEQGAAVIVTLAQVGPDGPTGQFFNDAGPVPW
jgi:NAD(P)-dependent dehydrogenase (short-subunit alcohol dehydrogenase family)